MPTTTPKREREIRKVIASALRIWRRKKCGPECGRYCGDVQPVDYSVPAKPMKVWTPRDFDRHQRSIKLPSVLNEHGERRNTTVKFAGYPLRGGGTIQ